VVVITPLHRGGEKSNTRGESLKQYVEVIREVAALYSFPVLNLYDEYGIDVTTNREDIEKYMPDEIHPNALGHIILAEKITAFLENL
jgi:lysophospholipase L1-like esterase